MQESREYNAWERLSTAWANIYRAMQCLGEEHPEYENIEKKLDEVNILTCRLHKYLPNKQEPALDERDRQEQERKKPIVTPITMSL